MAKTILPMKMSSLIKIALKDLRAAEKSEDYAINMGDWHSPDAVVCRVEGSDEIISTRQVCSVCFAGSVMAFSLNAKWSKEFEPDSFHGNVHQLIALNSLREGDVADAAHELELPGSAWDVSDYGTRKNAFTKFNRSIPDYDYTNRKKFHEAMSKLEDKLRKAGF